MPDEPDGNSASTTVAVAEPPSSVEAPVEPAAAPVEVPSEPASQDGEPAAAEPPAEVSPEVKLAEYELRLNAAEKAQAVADKALRAERQQHKREQDAFIARQNAEERTYWKQLAKEDPIAFADAQLERFNREDTPDPTLTAQQDYGEALIYTLRTNGPFAENTDEDRQAAIAAVDHNPQRAAIIRETGHDPGPDYYDMIRAEVQISLGKRDAEINRLAERNTALEQELQGFKARGNPGPEDTPAGSGGASNSYRTQVEAERLYIDKKISRGELRQAQATLPYQ